MKVLLAAFTAFMILYKIGTTPGAESLRGTGMDIMLSVAGFVLVLVLVLAIGPGKVSKMTDREIEKLEKIARQKQRNKRVGLLLGFAAIMAAGFFYTFVPVP